MSAIPFIFVVRDSTLNGQLVANLSPVFTLFKRLSDNADVAQPAISQVGSGLYKFSYDPLTNGDAVCMIDATSAISQPSDRYIVGTCSSVDEATSLSTTVASTVAATALSLNPAPNTYAEAMATIRALSQGRKVKNSSTNTMDVYAHDGTTVLFTITFAPNITAPTSSTTARA